MGNFVINIHQPATLHPRLAHPDIIISIHRIATALSIPAKMPIFANKASLPFFLFLFAFLRHVSAAWLFPSLRLTTFVTGACAILERYLNTHPASDGPYFRIAIIIVNDLAYNAILCSIFYRSSGWSGRIVYGVTVLQMALLGANPLLQIPQVCEPTIPSC